MFCVQFAADGRRHKSNQGFRNSEESERCFAQAVLQETNHHAQKQSGRRIAAAQAEINGKQKRQIYNRDFGQVDGQKCLSNQRENCSEENRSAAELVHFDVSLAAAQIESVVHCGFSLFFVAGPCTRFPGADFGGASLGWAVEGLAAAVSSGFFFITSGSVVSRTMTSSSFSIRADGRTRMYLKGGAPCFTSTIVPIGKSRGNMRSMPFVTTCSPSFTSSSFET